MSEHAEGAHAQGLRAELEAATAAAAQAAAAAEARLNEAEAAVEAAQSRLCNEQARLSDSLAQVRWLRSGLRSGFNQVPNITHKGQTACRVCALGNLPSAMQDTLLAHASTAAPESTATDQT